MDVSFEQIFNTKNWEKVTEYQAWEDYFLRTPCVKRSYLLGVGCGAIMTAHKLRLYPGNVRHSVSAGVWSFCAVFGTTFYFSAKQYNENYLMFQQAFRRSNIKSYAEHKAIKEKEQKIEMEMETPTNNVKTRKQ